MGFGLQWIVDRVTFPSPPSSYSLTSHPELFFIKGPPSQPSYPGVPCMLYAIPQGAPVLLVHAHSNGCDIGDMRQTLQNLSESLRVHVMSFEFPGYGLHVGSASMETIDEAALCVANFLQHELKVSMAQVVWYGRSIGSGVAIRMVHRLSQESNEKPGGVVLQCGFANFEEVVGHLFGRTVKRLVSPLWPNEAMVKELECPVLIIHGRNDTMIPIAQSEKLWNAVRAKDRSHFHACDCGHNDFNFRRCTLRPMYDFLLGVISGPNFPAANFTMEVSPSSHTHVHHIGPLRSKIPVYSFRRPELEEWLRRLVRQSSGQLDTQAKGAADSDDGACPRISDDGASARLWVGQRVEIHSVQPQDAGSSDNGAQGVLLAFDASRRRWRLRLDTGDFLLMRPENLAALAGDEGASAGDSQKAPLSTSESRARELKVAESPSPAPKPSFPKSAFTKGEDAKVGQAASKAAASRGKKGAKGKGDAELPPIPDFSQMAPAETDPGAALLQTEGMVRTCAVRVAAFLDRVQAHLDRIEDLEKKPLEEIVDMVETEFWSSDPLLCLWEEVDASGERVRIRLGPFSVDSAGAESFDPALGSGSASAPSELLRVPLWLFCPSPAHFRCLAEWSLMHSARLERNLSASGHPERGASCCCVPSVTARRRPGGRKSTRKAGAGIDGGAQPSKGALATFFAAHFVHWVEKTHDVKAMFSRFVTLYRRPVDALRRLDAGRATTCMAPGQWLAPKELSDSPWSPSSRTTQDASSSVPSVGSFPATPEAFSVAARAILREGLGGLATNVAAWQDGACDFQRTAKVVELGVDPSGDDGAPRHRDWTVARLLLHYERLLRGAADVGDAPDVASDRAGRDTLRPDIHATGLALNRAVKAFVQEEHRLRRGTQGIGPRPLLLAPSA